MEDANGKYSENIKYNIVKSDSGYNLIMTVDKTFLDSPDTFYPVVIDPTFITSGSSYTSDTYVCSEYPTTPYYTNTRLRTGKDDPYGIRRTYIRFKLPSGYECEGITSALLCFKLHSSGSEATDPELYAVRDDWVTDAFWKSDEINWEDMPMDLSQSPPTDYYIDVSSGCVITSGWYKYNVLDQIQK